MKKTLKKLLTLTLALCFLIAPVATAANAEGVQPRLNNTMSAFSNMKITSAGKMNIAYNYTGYPGITTKAVVTTYVEKRVLGLFWSRVDIGTTNDEWVDTFYLDENAWSRSYQLSDSGTYRVKIEFKIYGSGGAADVLNHEHTDSY